MERRRVLAWVLAFSLAPGGLAAADAPAAEDPVLASLQQMVGGLGYHTSLASDHQSFAIPWPANYNYTISFEISRDGSLSYAYVKLGAFGQDQLAKLDCAKLLEVSDTGDFYFSMEKGADGKSESLYANTLIPMNGLTPKMLRGLLQSMAGKLDDSAALWDASLWK